MHRLTAILLGLCLVAQATGCCKKLPNLRVAADESLKGRGDFRVHLVGVQAGDELAKLQAKNVGLWFSQSDPMRSDFEKQGRIRELTFRQSQFGEQAVASTDSIFQTWQSHGVKNLVVLTSMSGAEDARRRVIPLECKNWKGVSDVRININQSGIFVNPPPRP